MSLRTISVSPLKSPADVTSVAKPKTCVYLWDGQSFCLFWPLLRVGAGVRVCGEAGPVEWLEVDLGAEEVADGLQGAAGVGGQRGVSQQVGYQPVGFAHHRDVHHHAGARKLAGRKEEGKKGE